MNETLYIRPWVVDQDVKCDRGSFQDTDPLVRIECSWGIALIVVGPIGRPRRSQHLRIVGHFCSTKRHLLPQENFPPLDRNRIEPEGRHIMAGNFDQTKGKIKQAMGDLTDDKELKREGKADENAGKVKEFVEDRKDNVEDAIDKVKDKLT